MELFRASMSHNMLISVTKVEDVSRYGSLTLSSEGTILSLNEKGAVGKGYINGGVYALEEDILSFTETQFSRVITSQITVVVLERLLREDISLILVFQRTITEQPLRK